MAALADALAQLPAEERRRRLRFFELKREEAVGVADVLALAGELLVALEHGQRGDLERNALEVALVGLKRTRDELAGVTGC